MATAGNFASNHIFGLFSEVRDDTVAVSVAVLSFSDLKTFLKMTFMSLFSQF